jgi:hypothetical protein
LDKVKRELSLTKLRTKNTKGIMCEQCNWTELVNVNNEHILNNVFGNYWNLLKRRNGIKRDRIGTINGTCNRDLKQEKENWLVNWIIKRCFYGTREEMIKEFEKELNEDIYLIQKGKVLNIRLLEPEKWIYVMQRIRGGMLAAFNWFGNPRNIIEPKERYENGFIRIRNGFWIGEPNGEMPLMDCQAGPILLNLQDLKRNKRSGI